MGGQFNKELQGVVAALKSLPKAVRWCFIAERMGLMFMPQNGASWHRSDGWLTEMHPFYRREWIGI